MSPAGLAWYDTKGVWKPYRYLLVLNAYLLRVASGEILRLIINLPPRHGKSTLVSQYFPAWYTGLWPERRVLFASYEGNFAASWGLKARDVAMKHGADLFGVKVRRDVAAASHWQYADHGGGMSTAGVGGPFTGKGGHIGIIDDPIKNAEEARSMARREQIWEWFLSTFLTRLEPGGSVVIIQTRWNQDDLTGRCMVEQKGEWTVLTLPAIAKQDDMIGRLPGEALCPERFPVDALDRIRKSIGSYWYSALYNQSPKTEGGNIFVDSWFLRYRLNGSDRPGRLMKKIQVWDTAHKTSKENDYSTCTDLELRKWEDGTNHIYVTHAWRDKVTYPDLKRKAVEFYEARKPFEIVVEDKDAGAMLIQELKRGTTLPVRGVGADKDKATRGHAVSPMVESGMVHIPHDEDASWVEPWLEEVTLFPNGAHDDWYDGLCHGLARLKGSEGPGLYFIGRSGRDEN